MVFCVTQDDQHEDSTKHTLSLGHTTGQAS